MTSGILHHVVASITETLPSAIELLAIKAGMGRLLEMKVGSEAFEIDQGNCGCGQGNHAEIELCRGGRSTSIVSTASSTSTAAASATLSPRPLKATPPHLERDITTKLARNVSPGLLARMKFLNQGNDAAKKQEQDIGRLDEDEIRRLDAFHKRRSFGIERRGTAWSGIGPPPPGYPAPTSNPQTPQETPVIPPIIPQSTGESVPPLAMEPDTETESDHSSVVSTSDRLQPSESEAEADVLDMHVKYRLPDLTQTKSLSMPPTDAPSTAAPSAPATEPPSATETRPPTPPPKDPPRETIEAAPDMPDPSPPPQSEPSTPAPAEEVSVLDDNGIDIESYFKKRHFPRANSIYTLSKASFSNQIQQLTSMKLPPTTIASEITSLPSSTLAGRALHKAANDIRLWMAKAADVLSGLDAEDDVEWAAAAGREGLEEVDMAVTKFEGLVTVYISAIEDLQARSDISSLPNRDQATLMTQMEEIVAKWAEIKQTLKGIKNQVEIAMEWEELWNNVLGEIGAEVENLSRLVFEMEERRHRVISDSVAESAEKFDIAELETIVEETPRLQPNMVNKRFSMPLAPTVASPISPIPQIEHENTRLLALFAKLQPLRASLDFLPMRLASFQARASKIFPSACDELTRRKEQLEEQEKKLEADADALREELGEDKWVHSFRQAGSKAVAMYDSCMKSVQRLSEAIEEHDEEKIGSRIATYKDKRDHYPPSMKRVLELIDIEMKHRSTVNGEILRIQQDVRQKFVDLESVIKDMDAILDEFTASRKLRDSVSTVLSARTEASSAVDTPNSSPASSVVMSRKSSEQSRVAAAAKKPRQSSTSSTKTPVRDNRRYSSVPLSTPKGPHISSLPWDRYGTAAPRAMTSASIRSVTPKSERPAVKPRWNSSVNMRDTVVGHNFKPLTLTTPSPYRKGTETTPRSMSRMSSGSSIPVRSPLSRSALSPPPTTRPASTTPSHQAPRRPASTTPLQQTRRPASTTPMQQSKRPLASPMQSPSTPAKGKLPMRSTPRSSTPASSRQAPIAEEDAEGDNAIEDSPIARRSARAPSVLSSRRSTSSSSLTPSTPGRSSSRIDSVDGRASRVSGRQSSMGERPTWK
ncbi:KAR9-domain-containing protein [Phaeosphaeriaceae sp. SRC1lsM3a]|nr:KAR9-domain-containing protein [Stagonospora sp. SRC1lsM3a]